MMPIDTSRLRIDVEEAAPLPGTEPLPEERCFDGGSTQRDLFRMRDVPACR